MAAAPLAELVRVSKVYGAGRNSVVALCNVDVRVDPGEWVAIMGPSGSGKSTAMHIFGCLDLPSSGTHRFLGAETAKLSRDQRSLLRRRYLGFVFQRFHLLPGAPALENVELPLLYATRDPRARRSRAERALGAVGLSERAGHTPAELSGGEQQRVAIARAIVGDPLLLLADEPTGNLDARSRKAVLELLVELRRERGLGIVMVTHDPTVARAADRVVRFEDGRIRGDRGEGLAS